MHLFTEHFPLYISVPYLKRSSPNIFSFPDLSLTPSLLMAAAVSSWQLRQQKQRPSAGCLISGKNLYYSPISMMKHISACPVLIGQLPDFCFICPGPRPRLCLSNEGMNEQWKNILKRYNAMSTNKHFKKLLYYNKSTLIHCIKPNMF